MSLFGSKKKVYVSSTVYKMADDDTNRSSYIQEIIAANALGTSNVSMGEAIGLGIRNGPRASQKSFFRWAKNNYDFGMARAAINYNEVIDSVAVAARILVEDFASDPNIEVTVNTAFIDNADESYYGERFIYENRPELADSDWAADVDPDTNDIWIQYVPGAEYPTGTPISSEYFSEPGFDSSDTVLVAYYTARNTVTDTSYPVKVFIYKIGDGIAALDDYRVQLDDGTATREFYPFIPLRINNKSVFEAGSPATGKEDEIREAWKKGLGGDIDDALTEIEANPSLGDIDYAYLVFGVSLNTQSNVEKQYLFEFFRTLAGRQTTTAADFTNYQATNDTLGNQLRELNVDSPLLNNRAFNDPINPGYLQGVDVGTQSVAPQITNIHLTLPTPELGVLDMKISWSDISETRATGKAFAGAKVGEVEVKEGIAYNERTVLGFINGEFASSNPVTGLTIRKQINSLEYIEIKIQGLMHKNLIYKGKSVDITAREAMADPDESGFIIPLHEPTLKRLGSVISTELARESFILVFNSYQVVKTKWYQKGIFKVLLAIVIAIVVAVVFYYFGPEAAAATAEGGFGLLGGAATVGALLGFTGVLAIAVGAAVNAVAALIVLQVIGSVAGELFGDKIGQIITLIAAVAISLGSGPGGWSTGNMAANIGNMASIDKLLMMTNATTDLVRLYQQSAYQKIMEETQKWSEDSQAKQKELEELMSEFDGKNVIDPLMLVDFSNPLDNTKIFGENFVMAASARESPETFLSRTLATDLSSLSHSMVYRFVDLSLTLS